MRYAALSLVIGPSPKRGGQSEGPRIWLPPRSTSTSEPALSVIHRQPTVPGAAVAWGQRPYSTIGMGSVNRGHFRAHKRSQPGVLPVVCDGAWPSNEISLSEPYERGRR